MKKGFGGVGFELTPPLIEILIETLIQRGFFTHEVYRKDGIKTFESLYLAMGCSVCELAVYDPDVGWNPRTYLLLDFENIGEFDSVAKRFIQEIGKYKVRVTLSDLKPVWGLLISYYGCL